jgi:hypothetical protein
MWRTETPIRPGDMTIFARTNGRGAKGTDAARL